MKTYFILIVFAFLVFDSIAASIAPDTIRENTIWKGAFNVTNDIVVKKGVTLSVLPGASVNFGEGTGMIIHGDLVVSGTKENPVHLTTNAQGWKGIRFIGKTGELHNSKIDYAIIEKVKSVGTNSTEAAVKIQFYDKLTISNSIIRHNSGIEVGGIYVLSSNTIVTKCLIYKNVGECGAVQISVPYGYTPIVEHCTIAYNRGSYYRRSLLITDNSISAEYAKAASSYPISPKVKDTIIWSDENIAIGDITRKDQYFENCIIKGSFFFNSPTAISSDPLFVDATKDDYSLMWSSYPENSGEKSPAIDAASANSQNDPDGSPADIGAIPFTQHQGTFKPKSNFLGVGIRGTAPLEVGFFNSSSAGTYKNLLYHWDFGDGNTSNEKNPSHTYQKNGSYSVSLTVTDENGQSDVHSIPNYIKAGTIVKEEKASGTWTKAASPYLVFNDLVVERATSFRIEAGVEVEFQGEYELFVYGSFSAIGTKNNKILFQAKDTTQWTKYEYSRGVIYEEGWGGISVLEPAPTDTIRLSNCTIKNVGEYGRRSGRRTINGVDVFYPPLGALIAYKVSNFEVDSCAFISNFVSSSTLGYNDPMTFYYGNPGITMGFSKGKITNSIFTNNGVGSHTLYKGQNLTVFCSEAEIANNRIFNNKLGSSSSVILSSSNVKMHHNIIKNNDGVGLIIREGPYYSNFAPSIFQIYQNQISRHYKGILLESSKGITKVYNNWIFENKGAYRGAGIESDIGDAYITGNIIAYNENSMQTSNGGGGFYGIGKVIANNTIYGNKATNMGGGGIYTSTGGLIANNIIYGNYSGASISDYVFYQYDPTNHSPDATLKNNLIGLNPLFNLKDSLDFSLNYDSPAIDKGTADTTGLNLYNHDIKTSQRVDQAFGIIDIGALEYSEAALAPTDLTLSSVNVKENQSFIGKLTVKDDNKRDFHTYSIIPQHDSKFIVDHDRLELKQGTSPMFDFSELTIRATDQYGFSIERSFSIFGLKNPTAIKDVPLDKVMTLKPNPVIDHITISVQKPTNMVIYNVEGKLVKEVRLNSGENNVKLQSLPSGMYLLHFEAYNVREKIIKL